MEVPQEIMRKIFTSGKEKTHLRRLAALLIAIIDLTAMLPVTTSAHGGEDHSAEQSPVIAAGTGMVTRTARAGDWEVVIKHPSLEPDKELAARVFVTRFETNEPIANAQIRVTMTGAATPVEAIANAGSTAGIYEVRLPPLPQGEYRLAAQVSAGGANQTIQYGVMQVRPVPPSLSESSFGWARTALLALALIVGLGLAGFVTWRVMQNARRSHKREATAA